jgi:hypothetical protein
MRSLINRRPVNFPELVTAGSRLRRPILAATVMPMPAVRRVLGRRSAAAASQGAAAMSIGESIMLGRPLRRSTKGVGDASG